MSDISYPQLIRRLAEEWQLSEQQQRCLLQLEPAAMDELLKIDTTLKLLFAASPMLASHWMTSRNRGLANDTPMDLIEKEGMAGLRRIARFLCLEQ